MSEWMVDRYCLLLSSLEPRHAGDPDVRAAEQFHYTFLQEIKGIGVDTTNLRRSRVGTHHDQYQ